MSDDKRKPNERPKTRFEPVQRKEPAPKAAPTPPPPPPKQATPPPPTAPPPPPPAPQLRILAPGETPRSGVVQRDERGIIVGPQGVVVVQGVRRLVALLTALSQATDLAQGLALEAHDAGRYLVLLTPSDGAGTLSQFYDLVQGTLAAAQLSVSRARLFVGSARVMVPYADPAAPYGYDIDGAPPPQGRTLLRPAEAALHLDERPSALLDALVQVPLLPAPQPLPTTLTLLTDRRLAALVARYVHNHGLAYGVRFFTWQRGTQRVEAALFDIVSAAAVRPIHGFVCNFLRRLPNTTLLNDALDMADLEHEPARRILLAEGRRTPLHLPHIQELLPAHCLLILTNSPWGAALIPAPAPRTSMAQFTNIVLSTPTTTQVSTHAVGRLPLRLELRRNGPLRGPIHGLLLDAAALVRLQRLVRRLPAPLFAHARIALGDGVALVLAAEDSELKGLPLGVPLVRTEPPTLLLPRGMRLLPTLPQDLLISVLGMSPDTLTVLTPTARYAVPLAALQPLTGLLTLDTPLHTGAISVRPVAMPPLDLSDLDELPPLPPVQNPVEPPAPVPIKEQRNLWVRLLGTKPTEKPNSGDFSTELRQRAANLEQAGAYELAAAFYSYLQDETRAAACYQQATKANGE